MFRMLWHSRTTRHGFKTAPLR